jgi:hypothetical protein
MILWHTRLTIKIVEIYIIFDKNFKILVYHYFNRSQKLGHNKSKIIPTQETFLNLANGTIIVDLDA